MSKNNSLEVRETIQEDIEYFVNYWLEFSSEMLVGIGVIKETVTGHLEVIKTASDNN